MTKHNSRILNQLEMKRITTARSLARTRGEQCDLSPEEWLSTLSYFDYRCAYCGGSYALIEHFIPLGFGVGTVAKNCVPACQSCQGLKHTNWFGFRARAIHLREVIKYLRRKGLRKVWLAWWSTRVSMETARQKPKFNV